MHDWCWRWKSLHLKLFGLVWFMVFNAAFNNISIISWRSVLLVEETGVLGENHQPVVSHWQTLSHVVSSTFFNCKSVQFLGENSFQDVSKQYILKKSLKNKYCYYNYYLSILCSLINCPVLKFYVIDKGGLDCCKIMQC